MDFILFSNYFRTSHSVISETLFIHLHLLMHLLRWVDLTFKERPSSGRNRRVYGVAFAFTAIVTVEVTVTITGGDLVVPRIGKRRRVYMSRSLLREVRVTRQLSLFTIVQCRCKTFIFYERFTKMRVPSGTETSFHRQMGEIVSEHKTLCGPRYGT